MGLTIELLGVRGSLPTPPTPSQQLEGMHRILRGFLDSPFGESGDVDAFFETLPQHVVGGYGGNTTCVGVHSENHSLLIDGGTGIRNAVQFYMEKGCASGKGTVHILMTHFHWDHLMGLPFFVPLFIPGNQIHFYGVQPDLEANIRLLFKRPLFPVEFEALQAKIFFHRLEPRRSRQIQDFTVTPYMLDHPDPCWGYKIESGGKVYSHCVDTEGTRKSREELGLDLPLYQGVDLMVFDGQYSIEEAKEKINWGHSAAPIGLEIAIREKIKKVIFIHHDPWASDDKISRIFQKGYRFYEEFLVKIGKENAFHVDWGIGVEGRKFFL
jgi:phosphoribosyl 1,2-cyclic phosphodiesterase